MRVRVCLLAVLSLSVALASSGGPPPLSYTMTPNQGPVAGGTVVTFHGPFSSSPYGAIFGSSSVSATQVDASTLTAVTPAHLPGTAAVTLFELDRGIPTGLTFTYEGDPESAFERVLLPVYVPPVPGAFGSEFRTNFRARLANGEKADIFGMAFQCPVLCIEGPDAPYSLTTAFPDVDPSRVEADGNPGKFLYIPNGQIENLAMNLRVYDTSRSAENFGTEIPIVRARDFANGDRIVFLDVPTDPRFRNTLRIYSAGTYPALLSLKIFSQAANSEVSVFIPARPDLLHPGYVELSTFFPLNVGPIRVEIQAPLGPLSAPLPAPPIWAFVSVTNNETQHITTITPQP